MKELLKSLAKFQAELPTIGQSASGYGYKYAPLHVILEEIKPLLNKHGLVFTQLVQPNGLQTILFHVETGEKLESVVHIPAGVNLKGMNEFQVLGSGITYLRRYSISAMLGIVTDEDTDANEPGNTSNPKAKKGQAQNPNAPWLNEGTKEYQAAYTDVMTGDKTISELRQSYKVNNKLAATLEAAALKFNRACGQIKAAKTPDDVSHIYNAVAGDPNEIFRTAVNLVLKSRCEELKLAYTKDKGFFVKAAA